MTSQLTISLPAKLAQLLLKLLKLSPLPSLLLLPPTRSKLPLLPLSPTRSKLPLLLLPPTCLSLPLLLLDAPPLQSGATVPLCAASRASAHAMSIASCDLPLPVGPMMTSRRGRSSPRKRDVEITPPSQLQSGVR